MKHYISEDKNVRLYNGDCLDIMSKLIEKCVLVDAIITDPPYGITNCEHDSVINFKNMWCCLNKIKKNDKTPIILFSAEPYTSNLIRSNQRQFKYKTYWKKDRPSGFLNAKKQPLRDIEEICVFYKKQCIYNPIMWEGKPLHGMGIKFKATKNNNSNYNEFDSCNNPSANRCGDTSKFPRQVLEYPRPHPPIHPTEKPVALLEYLIKTYTNEGDTVLDFTMGSGSTGVACKNLNRKFIGIELDEKYFDIAVERIKG